MATTKQRRRSKAFGATLLGFALVAAACSSDSKESVSNDTAAPTSAAPGSTVAGADTTAAPDTVDTTATTTGGGDTTVAPDTVPVDTVASEGDPVTGGDLIMGVEADTSSPWRPAEMVCAISCHQVIRSVFDTLMLPGADKLPHPYLASAMEPNEDFTVWRITAREGVKFHDGTDFDGAAIVDNLTRHKTALLTGTAIKSVLSIELDPADPMTAVVTVEKPWATFPVYLTGQIGYMASPTWLAASDTDDTLKSKPVGTGPFVFEDYKPNEYFKATKNPDYWNQPYPYLDSIEFVPINDALQRKQALDTGSVNLIHATNGQVITEIRDNASDYSAREITADAETGYTMLHVTQPDSPLQDVRVRCALAYATDETTLNDAINLGVNKLANGPFSPDQVGYLEDSGFPLKQDMAKAQELIADYKADNPGALTLALATTTDETNLVTANFQKQWFEEAGIDEVTIDQIDQGNYIVQALLGNFQVFQWRNHGGLELDSQYVWWHSSSSLDIGALALNFGRIRDPDLDALLDANRASTDPAEKKQIAEDVNRLFAKQCYNLWGTYTVWVVAGDPNIRGIAGTNLELPDGGGPANEGSGIAGTFYPQTLWLDNG
jgi:peptide/nickel transport system substrate-binding protein